MIEGNTALDYLIINRCVFSLFHKYLVLKKKLFYKYLQAQQAFIKAKYIRACNSIQGLKTKKKQNHSSPMVNMQCIEHAYIGC